MVAGASIRTLHPTITTKEVAAHAQGETVRLVLAEELVRGDGGHLGQGRVVPVVVDEAVHVVHVGDGGQPVVVAGVHHPLHLAAAMERVLGHQKCGLL